MVGLAGPAPVGWNQLGAGSGHQGVTEAGRLGRPGRDTRPGQCCPDRSGHRSERRREIDGTTGGASELPKVRTRLALGRDEQLGRRLGAGDPDPSETLLEHRFGWWMRRLSSLLPKCGNPHGQSRFGRSWLGAMQERARYLAPALLRLRSRSPGRRGRHGRSCAGLAFPAIGVTLGVPRVAGDDAEATRPLVTVDVTVFVTAGTAADVTSVG